MGPGDGLLVLLAERNAPDLNQLVEALRELDLPFFGGVFPGLIHGGERHEVGAVLQVLPLLGPPVLIADLEQPMPRLVDPGVPLDATQRPTALVFVDGLSTHVASWLRTLYAQLGTTVTYLGGGAGSLSFEPRPCVFTQDGVAQSGGVVALSPLACNVGVRHGWTRMAGPLVATRTDRTRVHELNWRAAAEVYQEAIGEEIPEGGFFAVSKGHPFGLRKEGQEDVIRDPLTMEADGSLVCAGEVPQNAVLNVMRGDPDSLIAAAGLAAQEALREARGAHRATLVIDCVSRTLFLEERLDEELKSLAVTLEGGSLLSTPSGALTLGEIASRGDSLLEWFNKTVVVGVLHEPG